MSAPNLHPLAELYLKLTCDRHLWTDGLDGALRTIIAAVNAALKTERAGLWSLGPDRQTLTLVLGYSIVRQSFRHGAELSRARYAQYFDYLETVVVDGITDVQNDIRMREFVADGVVDPEMKSALIATVHVAGANWGTLVVSDFKQLRTWTEWECWFLSSISGLIAQLITYAEADRNQHWLLFVADNLPIGILKFDIDAQCDYANPQWRRLTGAEPESAHGEGWLRCVHPDDRDAIRDKVRMVGVSGERAEAELRLYDHGKTIWLACAWVAERNIEGMPIAILGTFADVTHERALRESNQRLQRINNIAARLYGLRDIETVARASVEILSEHVSAPLATFFTFDAATNVATLLALRDGGGRILNLPQHAMRMQLQRNFEQDIDVLTDMDLPQRTELRERGTQSVICIWLRHASDRIGLVALEYREVVALEDSQRDDLAAIGKAISMALSNVMFIARVEHQATHDALTGLPNREFLRGELAALNAEPNRESILMLLDLDRFREINDTLGHHVGDQLLVTLAQRLTDVLQGNYTLSMGMAHEADIAGSASSRSVKDVLTHNRSEAENTQKAEALLTRLGGDEFGILLRGTANKGVKEIAELLIELLRQPFLVDDMILEIGGSIGVAVFPRHSQNGIELLRLADVAMYHAKRSGSGYALYDRQFDSYTPERLVLMQELRGAIVNKQLTLHYQPRLNLRTGEVEGFEALVRWQHPQRGLLAPGVFLPLAEMSDVIHALTIEVFEQALIQQQEWRRRGLRYSIAVNLSVRNLINDECFRVFKHLIEKHGAEPGLLELEITETALMHDPAGAAKLLGNFASLGLRLSVDDFGTGYSSLMYLKQLPIHALKIDRAFVCDMARDESDATIVKSTIALAHNLKLDVIAEGVEDEAALRMLREMGCDHAQGYYISKPQAVADIESWLESASQPRMRE